MKAGLVGRVYGDFESIDTSEFPQTRTERGKQLLSTINIREQAENVSGTTIIEGSAAEQIQSEVNQPAINEQGQIIEGEPQVEVETISTTFATVPGEFVVVESSNHQFAFDLIGRTQEVAIEPIQFNLDKLANDFRDDASFWMGGFYDHEGEASNGVAYGDNVFDDPEIGSAVWGSRKNQLGMDFEHNSAQLRIRITEGGYVQVFQPSEYGTLSFIRLINDFLLQYESKPEVIN